MEMSQLLIDGANVLITLSATILAREILQSDAGSYPEGGGRTLGIVLDRSTRGILNEPRSQWRVALGHEASNAWLGETRQLNVMRAKKKSATTWDMAVQGRPQVRFVKDCHTNGRGQNGRRA